MCRGSSLTASNHGPHLECRTLVRAVRHRTRSYTRTGTTTPMYDGAISGSSTSANVTHVSTVDDSHGRPVVDSAFNSTQENSSLALNGVVTGTPYFGHRTGRQFDGYPIFASIPSGIATGLLPVPSGWYLDVVVRSNPSRPVMTPLTLLQDFVELPAQVRELGSLLMKPSGILSAKQIANQNLAVQFGWIPLVNDLSQLLDLQALTLRRARELRHLYTGRGLRRRLKVGEDTQEGRSATGVVSLPDSTRTFSYSHDVFVVRKQWATIRWHPITPPLYVPSDEKLNRLARRAVLGLTPEGLLKGAWDIVPWTWLLAWFTSMGKYLQQYSNTVPATHTGACLMNECTVTCTARPGEFVSCSGSLTYQGSYKRTIKTRVASGSVTPGFYLPFIGEDALSILGSLFVQRALR